MDTMTGEAFSPLALFGAKLVGAVGGSVISIAYLLPRDRRDAAVRFLTGAVTGLVFGGPAGIALSQHLGLVDQLGAAEVAVMGSAAASLCAWWALGVIQRFADGLFKVAGRARNGAAGRGRAMTAASGARMTPGPAADGTIRGYASLFGRTDLSGDRVEPGAFAGSLARRLPVGVRMLWQHDPARPIGVWTRLIEDRRGLYAEGRLALDSAGGREAFELLRAGAVDGLSIGFRTRRARALRGEAARRLLLDIDLWEISVVTFPMQEAARVSETRSMPLELLARITDATRRIALPKPAFGG